MRTKHALYQAHKYRIGLADTPDCICEEIADLQHIVLECPIYLHYINGLYKNLEKLKVKFPTNLDTLLSSGNINIYYAIYNYIKTIALDL